VSCFCCLGSLPSWRTLFFVFNDFPAPTVCSHTFRADARLSLPFSPLVSFSWATPPLPPTPKMPLSTPPHGNRDVECSIFKVLTVSFHSPSFFFSPSFNSSPPPPFCFNIPGPKMRLSTLAWARSVSPSAHVEKSGLPQAPFRYLLFPPSTHPIQFHYTAFQIQFTGAIALSFPGLYLPFLHLCVPLLPLRNFRFFCDPFPFFWLCSPKPLAVHGVLFLVTPSYHRNFLFSAPPTGVMVLSGVIQNNPALLEPIVPSELPPPLNIFTSAP